MTAHSKTPAGHGRSRTLAAGALLLAAACATAYWTFAHRYDERTDDASVAGNIVQVTPQVSGTVLAIDADDTDYVAAGTPLVVLDRSDLQVSLERADARLAETVRKVRTLYADGGALHAAVALREAEVAKAADDLRRRMSIAPTGALSGEEIRHSRTALDIARAALTAAREHLAANQALTDRTTVRDHPAVRSAAAQAEAAYLAYRRAEVVAPVSGLVARRSVQVGGRVAPGQPLLSIVPLKNVWVEANFKEMQLEHMRIGQAATLTADLYGRRVVYHGKVAGLAAGTGAVFSLLPPQNASGNWIKVVQRVPVRIALRPEELAAHPLRIGLSMQVDVNVKDQSGAQLAKSVRHDPIARTRVYDALAQAARTHAQRIIAAQLPSASPGTAKAAEDRGTARRRANDGGPRETGIS